MNTGIDSLRFMISPVDRVICLITDTNSVFESDIGYYNESLNIIINKSCSGFNFMLICFVMISVHFAKNIKKEDIRKWLLPGLLPISYIITIFVNSSRILLAIQLTRFNVIKRLDIPWLHQGVGIFVYLSFLILIYMVVDKKILKG